MLRQYGIEISTVAGATVAALVVAKVVLLTDLLPFVNRFPDKPLIYNVVWKTAIYLLAAFVVHYLEHLVPLWWRARDLSAANRQLLDEIVWLHFWAIQLWLFVLLFLYCALRELVRALGADEVRRMFFGPLPIPHRTGSLKGERDGYSHVSHGWGVSSARRGHRCRPVPDPRHGGHPGHPEIRVGDLRAAVGSARQAEIAAGAGV